MSAEALSPERAFEVWDGRTYGETTLPWPATWQVRVVPPNGDGEQWTVGFFDTEEDAASLARDLERHAQAIRAEAATTERNRLAGELDKAIEIWAADQEHGLVAAVTEIARRLRTDERSGA